MKTLRKLLLATFMLVTFGLSAQTNWTLSGTNIYNNNSGFVGIGNSGAPTNLLHVSKNMTGPQIIIQNLGGIGGAGFTMIDNLSGGTWKFKSTSIGGFKIRDHGFGLDVITIEPNSSANAIYIGSNGVIGLHTNAPSAHSIGAALDIRGGDIYFEDANAFLQINNTLTSNNTGIFFSEVGANKCWIWYSGSDGYLRLNTDPSGWRNDLVIHNSGAIGIGTGTIAAGYLLSVNGDIACEEVLVQDLASWPDYVFTKGYKLMNLRELEKSIQKDHHLPGLPSAAEVEENGVSLGEMQSIFLEKLEELTLYTIEQGKQLEEHQKKIEELQKENKKLRRQK